MKQLQSAHLPDTRSLSDLLGKFVLVKPAITVAFFFYSTFTIGQQKDPAPVLNYYQVLERLSRINQTSTPIQGIPRPKPVILGSSFLNDHFAYTSFLTTGGKKSQTYFAKYNMLFDEFLVVRDGAYYALSGKEVLSFSWVDSLRYSPHRFVRFDLFKTPRPSTAKFVEILAEGKLTLAKATEAVVADPNYNVALDAGRRDTKIFTKEILFYVRNDTAYTMPAVKQIPMIFESQRQFMTQFIDINSIDLKNEVDLAAVFEFYNDRVARLKEN
jgi:hypothetical protein